MNQMLYNVFKSMQRMFVESKKIKWGRSPSNAEAARLLDSNANLHLFIEKAYKSVQESEDALYHNEASSSLIVKDYNP